ncbi:hypothetical protein [Plantactinospora sp. B24E8]|uniref:hypothetical protein n=1 Tax=Plantactinospora sp. B24E8 TaxID=3153567 RepID=UPI00325C6781
MVRPIWSLPGPALGALLAAGLLTVPVGPLGDAYRRDLGLTTAAFVLTFVVPYVLATAALVVPGHLLGRRWPTATAAPALVLMLLGSLVVGLAPSSVGAAVGRLLLGLGAGTVVGVTLALSGQMGRGRSPARLVLGLACGAALLVGPAVSGALTMSLSWRTAALVDVLVAGMALVLSVLGGLVTLIVSASRPGPPAAVPPTTPLPREPLAGEAPPAGPLTSEQLPAEPLPGEPRPGGPAS